MSSSMSASEARASLPQILDRVLAGEEVTITRHGQPVAVVVRPDALRVRRAAAALTTAASIRDSLAQGRAAPLKAGGAVTEKQARALLAEVRASRSHR